jgi:hypothetical protein
MKRTRKPSKATHRKAGGGKGGVVYVLVPVRVSGARKGKRTSDRRR